MYPVKQAKPETTNPSMKVIVDKMYISFGFFSAILPKTAPLIPKKKIARLKEISAWNFVQLKVSITALDNKDQQ